ncbi:hypothetical protein CLV78_11412 [Aliiruegeria haliotis]|uniref:Transposase n=1 Tax=Aliiruegeria haliotis TaxID=1280846 RepID=A0A2T0RGF3_9RHOB|nr:hypothetical protein CLV78_11412 [Aliiruegeria haliotis]
MTAPHSPRPKIDPWRSELAANTGRPKRERLTLVRVYQELRNRGYGGGYDAVRRYAADWSKATQEAPTSAKVPLSIDPGEAYQFDRCHEIVILGGVKTTAKVAHVRLCHSRMLFVRAYPCSTVRTEALLHTGEGPVVERPVRSLGQDAQARPGSRQSGARRRDRTALAG